MQAQIHRKYGLESSRKRSIGKDQNEETLQPLPPKPTDKGKKPINPISPTKKYSSNPITNESRASKTEKFPPKIKENYNEKKQPIGSIKIHRIPFSFSLQKELEKLKIVVPLTKLLKQPIYKAQMSQFMSSPTTTPLQESLNLQEEMPMVVFGPHVEEYDPSTPPLCVNLVIHELLLHNFMLDS